MHKSAECKECKLPGHTIDPCPQRNDSESYCQFCQAANAHSANNCEVIVNLTRMNTSNDLMKNLSLEKTDENMEKARWQSRNAVPNRGQPPSCWNCGDQRHFARNCPQNSPSQNRGGFSRGRGDYQRGGYRGNNWENQNQNPNENRNNNNGYPRNQFHRGGYRGRGNPNYRNRDNGNAQPNYGQNNFPNYFNSFPFMPQMIPNFYPPYLFNQQIPNNQNRPAQMRVENGNENNNNSRQGNTVVEEPEN